MYWSASLAQLLDPYDLRARFWPGLLLLLPVISFLALVFGPRNPALVTITSVLMTCGGPYLLSSFVRTWGQRAQIRLYQRLGAQPTTILLRHRDVRLPAQTKERYYGLIAQKLGLAMPSELDEHRDPHSADEAYRAAADALRPLTNDRKKFPFVFKELVAYGFNRNAYGSRWVGVCICAAAVVATFAEDEVLTRALAGEMQGALHLMDLRHVLTALIAIAFCLIWLYHFTSPTVEQAGFSYALRLWEALPAVNKIPAAKRHLES